MPFRELLALNKIKEGAVVTVPSSFCSDIPYLISFDICLKVSLPDLLVNSNKRDS
ncbi:MAG: hypothetical protein K0R92_824 [Lachnospiraceae bacterium]|jgi:hypothetical protein|nr:hypothetical protein [Lachnospiraceae bacterium]